MASSRYTNRKKFINAAEHYKELFKERVNSRNLEQYATKVTNTLPASLRKTLIEVQHTWQVGDQYWKLAERHYGNGRYWWVIARYNHRPTEAHVRPGTTLRIPKPLDKILSYYR